jgi:DHA3 family macrolide efflux protein-like MFS transporter
MPPSSMRTFWLLWCGQLASMLGSGATQFALAVWTFQRTGSATQLGLVAMCAVLPGLLVSPLAGVLVDRWNRRTAMVLADAGAAITTAAVAALLACDRLATWHLCVSSALVSMLAAFHQPAYAATTTLLVPKGRLGKASGAVQMADALAELAAPALGGAVLASLGLIGVFAIDLLTFAVATTTLLAAHVPTLPRARAAPSFRRESAEAARYLRARPGLLGLLGLAAVSSLAVGSLEVLSAPVVLAVASPAVLGAVRSFAGLGMLAGSIAMQLWGGPQRRVAGVVGFQIVVGAHLVIMGALTAPWALALAGFGALFALPLGNGCALALWQSKVEPRLQGRVFALLRVARISRPLGYLAAGALAEAAGPPLALALVGLVTIAATLAVARQRPLRNVQHELPDIH